MTYSKSVHEVIIVLVKISLGLKLLVFIVTSFIFRTRKKEKV